MVGWVQGGEVSVGFCVCVVAFVVVVARGCRKGVGWMGRGRGRRVLANCGGWYGCRVSMRLVEVDAES